jgi:hypothetical protein
MEALSPASNRGSPWRKRAQMSIWIFFAKIIIFPSSHSSVGKLLGIRQAKNREDGRGHKAKEMKKGPSSIGKMLTSPKIQSDSILVASEDISTKRANSFPLSPFKI